MKKGNSYKKGAVIGFKTNFIPKKTLIKAYKCKTRQANRIAVKAFIG